MNMLLQKSSNRAAFFAWIAGELRRISQKRNKLAILQTFELKSGGATRSALVTAGKKYQVPLACLLTFFSTFVSPATYYRNVNRLAQHQRQNIVAQVGMVRCPVFIG